MRCGWGGPLQKLYTFFGLILEETERETPRDFLEKLYEILEGYKGEASEQSDTPIWVPETSGEWLYTDNWEWLYYRLRSIPYDEIVTLMQKGVIRRGTGRDCDRVYFFDIYDDKIRYWTARTIYDKIIPRYKNPKGVSRDKILYNQQEVEDYRPDDIFICEGVISAIVVGSNAVATYGRCVTEHQVEILTSMEPDRFIIVSESDRDAKRNTLILARALARRNKKVVIINCPEDQDPADLGREEFHKYANEHQTLYGWDTEVMRRLGYV
jgi:hypothetical protein